MICNEQDDEKSSTTGLYVMGGKTFLPVTGIEVRTVLPASRHQWLSYVAHRKRSYRKAKNETGNWEGQTNYKKRNRKSAERSHPASRNEYRKKRNWNVTANCTGQQVRPQTAKQRANRVPFLINIITLQEPWLAKCKNKYKICTLLRGQVCYLRVCNTEWQRRQTYATAKDSKSDVSACMLQIFPTDSNTRVSTPLSQVLTVSLTYLRIHSAHTPYWQ
jgi:hypothetical protein